jgi:hypothetical protein
MDTFYFLTDGEFLALTQELRTKYLHAAIRALAQHSQHLTMLLEEEARKAKASDEPLGA